MTVVVVTGASRGIGAEIARTFAKFEKNITLFLLAQTEDELLKVTQACQQLGANARYFVCDVTEPDRVKLCADQILDEAGAPDVLINNAGLYAPSVFATISIETFKAQIDVNLTSAFLVTRAFLPAMLIRKTGDIFFMCSIASLNAYDNSLAYTTAKHGLLGLARSLRQETENQGLRVVSILPGAVKTPSWDAVNLPEERFIPPSDIANIILDVHRMDRRTNVDEVLVRPQRGDI